VACSPETFVLSPTTAGMMAKLPEIPPIPPTSTSDGGRNWPSRTCLATSTSRRSPADKSRCNQVRI
jgi:hypothetical protein